MPELQDPLSHTIIGPTLPMCPICGCDCGYVSGVAEGLSTYQCWGCYAWWGLVTTMREDRP